MSGPIQRPEFFEGQVLAAADLGAVVGYGRNQLARHERYLHEWGIAFGLDLNWANNQLTIGAGVAIDGTGREIVVDSSSTIDAPFTQKPQKPKGDDWFPVFLVGKDEPAPASSALTGVCDSPQATRTNEHWDILFGQPGDEQNLNGQPAPTDPTQGPGGGTDDQMPWQILVGFVQRDTTNSTFQDAQPSSPDSSVGRKYAGVLADDVRARGSSLTLETSNGSLGKPQLTIDETGGGELDFRLAGQSTPLFKIDVQGNLTVAGKLNTGGPQPGAVMIESGTVSDGMVLPLPNNLAVAAVQAMKLHVQLTMHPPGGTFGNANTIVTAIECSFDPTTLVVNCRARSVDISTSTVTDLPWSCDFIVAVTTT
jgi:hypothetical protein